MGSPTESDSGSDSEFYGQPETIVKLRQRARLRHKSHANPTEEDAPPHATPAVAAEASHVESHPEQQLQNPFAGVPYAWQLGESIDEFVHRLPPSTTELSEHTPCIYICNPHVKRTKKAESGSQAIRGCADEGLEAEGGAHTALFVEGARERLGILAGFLGGLKQMGLSPATASRDAQSARQVAIRDVLGLAGHLGVTCGKWMLFVHPREIEDAWKTVALATQQGRLGIAAKTVPGDPATEAQGGAQRGRLICVYTSDFRDTADVGRVLLRLETLGLVHRHGGPSVYYKCDAFTYLGIGAVNPWGLRASLFSSKEVFHRLDGA